MANKMWGRTSVLINCSSIVLKGLFTCSILIYMGCNSIEKPTSQISEQLKTSSQNSNDISGNSIVDNDTVSSVLDNDKEMIRETETIEDSNSANKQKYKHHVSLGEVNISGHASSRTVRNKILGQLEDVKTCYSQKLLNTVNLSGNIIIQSKVSREGVVILSSVIGTTVKDESLVRCVKGTVTRWIFPHSTDNDVYLLTIQFAFVSNVLAEK